MNLLKESDVDVFQVSGKESDFPGADFGIVMEKSSSVPGKDSDRSVGRRREIRHGLSRERRDGRDRRGNRGRGRAVGGGRRAGRRDGRRRRKDD